jgi:RNA polymerase sigma-70 factor (ECF subfamily)
VVSLVGGLFGERKRKSSDVAENSENELPGPSDSELLDQIQQGDDCAATALYKRYADRLLRLAEVQTGAGLAKRIEAEDVVQSVFRTFFRRAATGHYALPDGDELWKLFLVIALNKIRKKSDFHRAAKRDVDRTQSIGNSQISSDDEASQILKMTVEELIAELPPSHRGVIHDRIQGFEVADLAERNQLSRRTVERILQNFRDRMRQELQEYADL